MQIWILSESPAAHRRHVTSIHLERHKMWDMTLSLPLSLSHLPFSFLLLKFCITMVNAVLSRFLSPQLTGRYDLRGEYVATSISSMVSLWENSKFHSPISNTTPNKNVHPYRNAHQLRFHRGGNSAEEERGRKSQCVHGYGEFCITRRYISYVFWCIIHASEHTLRSRGAVLISPRREAFSNS